MCYCKVRDFEEEYKLELETLGLWDVEDQEISDEVVETEEVDYVYMEYLWHTYQELYSLVRLQEGS